VRQLDRDASSDGEVTLAGEQAVAGEVHGDERRGARRLHVHARASEVEQVREPRGEEVLIVPRVAQEEHADVAYQIGVRAQVEVEVAAHSAAAEDTDGPAERLGRVTGVLEGLPGTLEEVAVLRVEDGALLRGEAEELAVEVLHAGQRRAGADVRLLSEVLGILAGGEQLLVAVALDRLDAVAQVAPEGP
jgi:hypothetical protein